MRLGHIPVPICGFNPLPLFAVVGTLSDLTPRRVAMQNTPAVICPGCSSTSLKPLGVTATFTQPHGSTEQKTESMLHRYECNECRMFFAVVTYPDKPE